MVRAMPALPASQGGLKTELQEAPFVAPSPDPLCPASLRAVSPPPSCPHCRAPGGAQHPPPSAGPAPRRGRHPHFLLPTASLSLPLTQSRAALSLISSHHKALQGPQAPPLSPQTGEGRPSSTTKPSRAPQAPPLYPATSAPWAAFSISLVSEPLPAAAAPTHSASSSQGLCVSPPQGPPVRLPACTPMPPALFAQSTQPTRVPHACCAFPEKLGPQQGSSSEAQGGGGVRGGGLPRAAPGPWEAPKGIC